MDIVPGKPKGGTSRFEGYATPRGVGRPEFPTFAALPGCIFNFCLSNKMQVGYAVPVFVRRVCPAAILSIVSVCPYPSNFIKY